MTTKPKKRKSFFAQLISNIRLLKEWKSLAAQDDALAKHILKQYGAIGFLTVDLF